jgi:hypothetical protein
MQPYHFNDVKKHFVILVFKSTPPKRSGVDCDVIVQTVNAHLTVGKYCRLTNEITHYKLVALEFEITTLFLTFSTSEEHRLAENMP